MAATIDDLRGLGYLVGVAHGSVPVEEDALAAAHDDAKPDVILDQVHAVVTDTLADIRNAGNLPADEGKRRELAALVAQSAMDALVERADARVAFHERALEIAKASPDVWRVEHRVGDPPADGDPDQRPTVASLLVACKADGTGWDDDSQAVLDALADPAAHAEREWQIRNEVAISAADRVAASGADVVRDPGQDGFTVDGEDLSCREVVARADELADASDPAP